LQQNTNESIVRLRLEGCFRPLVLSQMVISSSCHPIRSPGVTALCQTLSRPNHSIHQVVAVVAAVAATLSLTPPALSTPFRIRKIVTSAGRLRLYSRRTEREQKLDLPEMLADVPGKLKRAHIIFSMRSTLHLAYALVCVRH